MRGPAALMRGLSQIGVVENDAQGQRLHGELEQGQRLVSTNGSLWRWDGYIAAAGAPTAAARRLAQRNRLEEMRNELEIGSESRRCPRKARADCRRGARRGRRRTRRPRSGMDRRCGRPEYQRRSLDAGRKYGGC